LVPEAVNCFRQQFPQTRVTSPKAFPNCCFRLCGTKRSTSRSAGGVVKLDSALAFHPLFRHDFVSCPQGPSAGKADSLAQLAEANWVSLLPAAGGPLDRVFSQAGLSVPQQ